ncbi:hypothetical protein AUJ14_05330 [Candidatus Micrarchaeota archaeon CG1_02_55_22]|nr:MAG: hypothetical protein AUJ14_05330 [Candidatus Micrarchaeota archaeon CG1_02_55_22]
MKLSLAVERIVFKQKREPAWHDALLFLVLFTVFSSAFYLLLSAWGGLPGFAASTALPLTHSFGLQTSLEWKEFPHITGWHDGAWFDAEINSLCGGAIELAVLLGLVAASRDRSLPKRLVGIIAGVVAVLIFNPIRIALTLSLYGSPSFVLAHDVLFRISIVAIVLGVYAAWYLGSRKG